MRSQKAATECNTETTDFSLYYTKITIYLRLIPVYVQIFQVVSRFL